MANGSLADDVVDDFEVGGSNVVTIPTKLMLRMYGKM